MAVPQAPALVPILAPDAPASAIHAGSASIAGAIGHDLATISTLIDRQLALPLRPGGLAAMLALIAAAFLVTWLMPILVIRGSAWLVKRRAGSSAVAPLAEAVTTVAVVCMGFGFGAMLMLAGAEAGLTLLPIMRALGETFVAGAFVAGFGIGVGFAIAAVEDPEHRPFEIVADDWVYRFYCSTLGTMLALSGLVEQASRLIRAAAPTRDLAHGVVLLVEVALIVGFLIRIGASRDRAEAAGRKPYAAGMAITATAWAAVTIGVVAFLLGWVSFAVLLFQEMIWTGLIAIAAIMLTRLVEELFGQALGDDRAASRFATHIVGIRPERVTQAALLVSAVASVLIWLIAASLIVAPLGGKGVALVDQVRGGVLIAELERLHIAPMAIVTGVATLVVGMVLTRILRRWLERRFLPATALDIGARASIVTGVSYAAILLVLVAAVDSAGINLGKVTLIASALSVGVGFGLQSIIQNFVSGIILLGERPIKVGDWVSASGAEGSVRRIRVRATELATADGSLAIVPNSSFISGTVTNRTGAGIAGRVEVIIRIGGVDTAAQARDMLLALVDAAPGLMKTPPPQLLLTDMTADGFGFTLQVYADRRRPIAEVRSELLYALVDGLSNDLKVTIG
jgi:potassium efflux system protein